MNIYEQRDLIEKQACEYLKQTIYSDQPDQCPIAIWLRLSLLNKEIDEEAYKKHIEIFKTLFHSNNQDLKIALWNGIRITNDEFSKTDFTKEEYDFLIQRQKKHDSLLNANSKLFTKRLILRAIRNEDWAILAYHFEHDGDFELFSLDEKPIENVKVYTEGFAQRNEPLFFAVVEKISNTLIGYVGLVNELKFKETSDISNDATTKYRIEYYIFKDYRNKGYCKEAIFSLTDSAFGRKLISPIATICKDIYDYKTTEINKIVAIIATVNILSIKLIESCGFTHETTFVKSKKLPNRGWIDEAYYTLSKIN